MTENILNKPTIYDAIINNYSLFLAGKKEGFYIGRFDNETKIWEKNYKLTDNSNRGNANRIEKFDSNRIIVGGHLEKGVNSILKIKFCS